MADADCNAEGAAGASRALALEAADVTVTSTLLGWTPRLAAVALMKAAWSKLLTSPGTTRVKPTTKADRPPGELGSGGDGGGDGPGDGGGGCLGMKAGGGAAGDGGGMQTHSQLSEFSGIWP